MSKIKVAGYHIKVPRHRPLRVLLGIALVVGGILGFLPVLGYWMVPVGLAILAIDFAFARRLKRLTTIRLGKSLQRRWPWLARRLGYGELRDNRQP
jgi:purine-cytosine permease-like protein